MTSVADILKEKGGDVWTISTEQTVYDAIKQMDEKGVGALAVVFKGKLVGMLSERDYARKVILKGRSSRETKVKEIMTTHVYHTMPEETVESCMVVMTNRNIRHLPVMSDNELVGMISLGDVVREIIKSQQDKIKQLEHTVTWQESY